MAEAEGGCHCGAVRFRTRLAQGLATAGRCTCSYCRMKGSISVTVAEDGRRGLELARSLRPRAVLLDVTMPQMDGWDVLRALRADPEVARLHDAGIAHRRARIAALLREHESFLLYSHLVQVPDTPVLPMEQQLALCELRRHAQPDAKGRADEG